MKLLKKISKKFHSKKGITGTDIAAAIAVIVMTMGIVTGIYINVTNKSKENIRYSNATRIATQLIENIQANTYQDLIYRVSAGKIDELAKSTKDESKKIFGVNIPKGYSAQVTASNTTSDSFDIIRDVKVEVKYEISNTDKTITLYTTKERELLEQTNKPDMSTLPITSGEISSRYVPIKKVSGSDTVTVTSDTEWYNYDKGIYAIVAHLSNNKDIGSELAPADIQEKYVWIPRFGITDNNANLTVSNLGYAYGTSKYRISFGSYTNANTGKTLYSYMLTYSGTQTENSLPVSVNHFVNNTFIDNDGLTGIWYKIGDTRDTVSKRAYDNLNSVVPIENGN